MLYSIHFYYHKVGSRKPASKCEVLVFASSRERAEQLVKNMISPFDIEVEYFHVINMGGNKSLEEIYDQRPELKGIFIMNICIKLIYVNI